MRLIHFSDTHFGRVIALLIVPLMV